MRLTVHRTGQYREEMVRKRVRLRFKPATLAATARVFKLSPATRRRIRREVMEYLEKYKGSLGLSNGRGTPVRSQRRAAHKTAYRSAHAGRTR